ncbi:MAG: glycosyltransferase family 2 protein [Clostridia bacterium]|nr:glycosyltransferase family 2 protein [Clostridia bacterium]MBQ8716624.1 glycosyltransferase family 2 protein [Clostridia bacterium]
MKINVLLSTYNGEKYLREQLESLLSQNVDGLHIVVRDDGSTDATHAILDEYQNAGKLTWYTGENKGCAKSFWELVVTSPDADYYAFCDQDDHWHPDKLQIAVETLQNAGDATVARLYFSDVHVVDAQLGHISDGMVEKLPVDYAHSLIKNIAPGCTYVFNHAARALLVQYDPEKYGIDIHDWMAYKIIACFGEVVFDETPHLDYRQHGNNVLGASKTGIKAYFAALHRFFGGVQQNNRERCAKNLEACFGAQMSDENRRLTHLMAHYREDKRVKREILREPAFRFKGKKYRYFKFLIRLNKV